MLNRLHPGHVLLFALAGWMNRQQQTAIDYLREENRILREQLGGRRLRFTDDQRRRLAAKAGATLLGWHRASIARKWDFSSRRRTPGRPPLMHTMAPLIVRTAPGRPG